MVGPMDYVPHWCLYAYVYVESPEELHESVRITGSRAVRYSWVGRRGKNYGTVLHTGLYKEKSCMQGMKK